jgi:hypothetical protein
MKFNLIHIILIVAILYFIRCLCVRKEGMASLETGTYENTYPVGKCNSEDFKRTDCMVGNCPTGTAITDEHYCYLQCAQEPDPKLRKDCNNHCMEMMNTM